jgi:serine/threonine protein kinase
VLSAEAKSEPSGEVSLLPGQLVDGRYRVERLIGVGGMAAVWAATNERTGKRVALKVILRSLASTPAARELFYAEGLVASRVNHPNVVTIFDVVEHEGMACLVMELLDGEPLSRLIERKGRLSVEEACWLLLPAMRGVAAAHAQGVIHRDLKPQNIFLCVEPNGRIVSTKVLDFGISVLVERVLDLSRGLFLGTPNYMSPEHVSGAAIIDGRADVYSFGVLLYEVLTGQMAFPGEAGPALFNTIMNHPALSLTSLRPEISSGMAGVIDKAMAKRPDQRFGSLNAMVTGLEVELLAEGLGVASPSALPGSSGQDVASRPAKQTSESGLHQQTMMLYGSSSETQETTEKPGVGVQTRARVVPTVVVKLKSSFMAGLAKLEWSPRLGWKLGMATVLGVVLGIAVWKGTRPTRPVEAVNRGANAQGIQTTPTVVPFELPESVPETPSVIALPEPTVDLLVAVPEKPTMEVENKKRIRARSAMVASAARTRSVPQAAVAGKPRSSGEIETAASASSKPIRAGSLSADDF